jgi:hypothetical protein
VRLTPAAAHPGRYGDHHPIPRRYGYDLVVLANLDPPAAEGIAEAVRDWLGVRE